MTLTPGTRLGSYERQLLWVGDASQVRWSLDGREVFFRTVDNTLMAVPVTEAGGELRIGEAKALFTLPFAQPNGAGIGDAAQYDVLPNGHFVVNLEVSSQKTSFHVLTNWQALLK